MAKLYTKDHEWIEMDGDLATVGITTYAQEQLGDVVYVEMPEPGTAVTKGAAFGVVESVKAASDIYAPVSGEVVEANGTLTDAPETVNEGAEAGGWMIRLKIADASDLDGLMDKAAYDAFLETVE